MSENRPPFLCIYKQQAKFLGLHISMDPILQKINLASHKKVAISVNIWQLRKSFPSPPFRHYLLTATFEHQKSLKSQNVRKQTLHKYSHWFQNNFRNFQNSKIKLKNDPLKSKNLKWAFIKTPWNKCIHGTLLKITKFGIPLK